MVHWGVLELEEGWGPGSFTLSAVEVEEARLHGLLGELDERFIALAILSRAGCPEAKGELFMSTSIYAR